MSNRTAVRSRIITEMQNKRFEKTMDSRRYEDRTPKTMTIHSRSRDNHDVSSLRESKRITPNDLTIGQSTTDEISTDFECSSRGLQMMKDIS